MRSTSRVLISLLILVALSAAISCTTASDDAPNAAGAANASPTKTAAEDTAPAADTHQVADEEPESAARRGPGKAPPAATAEANVVKSIPEEERPFWDNAQKFVDAYASRDAKAIGELFTEGAEFYDEFGARTVGRDSIITMFQDVFESSPDATIEEIKLQRVRSIADNVVLEEGVTVTRESPSLPQASSRYIALHVKEDDGQWRINTLKSHGQQQADRGEHLGQLAWLVGDWVSEDSEAIVESNCRWSDDGNYLLRKFHMIIAGEIRLNGVQRIGWDPVGQQLRSWTFDSAGGFMQGTWTRSGNVWIVSSSGVTAEGQPASATALYTIVDAEMIRWQYRSLLVGNELHEDSPPIVMVRHPPAAATTAIK